MGKTKDVELDSMTRIGKALDALDDAARQRVLGWVNAKWQDAKSVRASEALEYIRRPSGISGISFDSDGREHAQTLEGVVVTPKEQKR
jgi:hypothetical protein